MVLRLFSASTQTHPGFKLGASPTLAQHSGFGPGNHYALEINPSDETQMVVEPGKTTRVFYFARDADGGLTRDEIAAEASISPSAVKPGWVVSTSNVNMYGLRSDRPIAWEAGEIGRDTYNAVFDENSSDVRSDWALFQRGGTYDFGLEILEGESPLHPLRHGAFGVGPRPIMLSTFERTRKDAYPYNVLFSGLDFRAKHSWSGVDVTNLIYADCNFTADSNGGASWSGGTGRSQITIYASSFIDNKLSAPKSGRATWNSSQDAGDGHFASGIDGFLRWRVLYDHNAWHETYNTDGVTFGGGVFGHPPSLYSHNVYDSAGVRDVTNQECISLRPPFSHMQCRGGAFDVLSIRAEGNAGGNFLDGYVVFSNLLNPIGNFNGNGNEIKGLTSGRVYPKEKFAGSYGAGEFSVSNVGPTTDVFYVGETIRDERSQATGEWVDYARHIKTIYGNLSYVTHMVTAGDSFKTSAVDMGVRGKALNGVYDSITFKNVIVANAVDPNNSAETTRKSAHSSVKNIGVKADQDGFDDAYKRDVVIFNWGAPDNDENASEIGQSDRNACTLGVWADGHAGNGSRSTGQACDYIRTLSDRTLQAIPIWNHFAEHTQKTQLGHIAGATAVFCPDVDGDGFRTDTPESWEIDSGLKDYPIDGDNCKLEGNLAHSYRTWRFADIDFGAGGAWNIFGGYISCTSTRAASSGTINTLGAGQFWFEGVSSTNITITAQGGRIGVAGSVSGLSGKFSNKAELLIITGGALTINSGDTIILEGGDLSAGFDGLSGSASLTVAGTLRFEAMAGAIGTVANYRSGKYGIQDLGDGIQGQPLDPSVSSTVVLASGSVIEVDPAGLAPGAYTLIETDILSDNGAALPSNVARVGNALVLTVV